MNVLLCMFYQGLKVNRLILFDLVLVQLLAILRTCSGLCAQRLLCIWGLYVVVEIKSGEQVTCKASAPLLSGLSGLQYILLINRSDINFSRACHFISFLLGETLLLSPLYKVEFHAVVMHLCVGPKMNTLVPMLSVIPLHFTAILGSAMDNSEKKVLI